MTERADARSAQRAADLAEGAGADAGVLSAVRAGGALSPPQAAHHVFGTRGTTVVAVLVLAVAAILRIGYMDHEPLWVDEAESSINALSILEHGYPSSEFLGIPIYENMLVRQWPEHPEYEFRDISYSDKGMAVYHGWLPLYVMAASFEAFGVQAPSPAPGWQIDIDLARFRYQTVAARAPSLLFGLAFVLFMGLAAGALAGADAALAAVVLTGLSASLLETTFQARYYAATLAFGALGALTLWRVASRGSAGDFARHAAVLLLLFFTNMFAVMNLLAATTVAVARASDARTAWRRYACCLAALAVAVAPWLIATGYVQHLPNVPSGRLLVRLPDDLVQYVERRLYHLAVFATGAAWLWLAWVRHGAALPERLREPWQRHRWQYVLLSTWMAAATGTYFLLSPPASLFPQRLSVALFVPGFLFMSMVLADAARTVSPHRSTWLAPALAVLYLATGGLLQYQTRPPFAFEKIGWTFEVLNGLHLQPDARVYASPSSNNVLMFYAGKPIQSLAPVRRSFLESYPGEVVYVEQQLNWEFAGPTSSTIRRAAKDLGAMPSDAEVESLRRQLSTRFARERTRSRVAAVVPELEPLSPLAAATMRRTRDRAQRMVEGEEQLWREWDFPFARGFSVRTGADWWQVFFYRLVDPVARGGAGLNAARRLKAGSAHFLPAANRVFFYSPLPLRPPPRDAQAR
jgi:hypothetical protein